MRPVFGRPVPRALRGNTLQRSVLIRGSTRAIGLATAAEFRRHGDRVAVRVEGMAGFAARCASKSSVAGVTRAGADELAGYCIRIYAILPGAVDTTLIQRSGPAIDASEMLRPDCLGRRIFEVAAGKYEPGTLIDIYS